MASNKKYWSSIEELHDASLRENLSANEFAGEIPTDSEEDQGKTSRRDFLKVVGFSTAAATLAACKAPVVKSVPYVVKPIEVTPGLPTYYASTFFNGYDFANVLVKNREGRPIKIDPNPTAVNFGTTSARVQASVLGLYDSQKYEGPKLNGNGTTWEALDQWVANGLNNVGNKQIVILTSSLPSPSTKKIIAEFQAKYPNTKQVIHDAVSYSPALDAAEKIYGKRSLPHYDLTNTKLVVSFAADFLGDWMGGDLEKSYALAKKPSQDMLRHVQVEANMSITGANADTRFPVKPSKLSKILAEVYTALNGGVATSEEAKAIAKELAAAGSSAVVFADGSEHNYALSYLINQRLGSTALSGKALLLKESNDKAFEAFVQDAKNGLVGAVISYQTNPVYSYAKGEELAGILAKIPVTISCAIKEDETSKVMKAIAPSTDWLESWGDFSAVSGQVSFQQPTIQPLFKSRQFQDSLLKWTGSLVPYTDYLKTFHSGLGEFNQLLYNGVNVSEAGESFSASGSASESLAAIAGIKEGAFEVQLYTKVSMGDGSAANNPWLQELPDPITRASWDNYATMSLYDTRKLGIEDKHNANEYNGRMQFNGRYISITTPEGVKLEKVPVFIQPGQAQGTIGLAYGYGKKGLHVAKAIEAEDETIGVNASKLYKNGSFVHAVNVEKQKGKHEFACIQMQNTLMGRYEIARDVSLKNYLSQDPKEWNEQPEMGTHKGTQSTDKVDLWDSFDRSVGHHFNLSIDLNACTGCGACIVSCQAENNVPVVGKEEVRMSRDMYWLRIDRYYASEVPYTDTNNNKLYDLGEPTPADKNSDGKLTQKEALQDEYTEQQISGQYAFLVQPLVKNPEVIFQPMLCQHCNHAPCETVCPVAATSHGRQGQNQMAYNRCVGTRYCANNCPYKVRRFNWRNYAQNDDFDFHMNDDLGRMVLNPDVAVRTRGVMEKCSFCIQSTQAVISKAKRDGKLIEDKDLIDVVACASACPTDAMVFGDINNPESTVSNLKKDKRKYEVLQDVGTKPNVFYHVKVRNK
ncbi:MAG: quinol:cytochrome C oxidoreductase [Flavobacteriaceae bacterium]|nr:MAG: quinol:cytochrome C oxidoreductase [Flavobacteriaceae bacterium]